MRTLKIAGDRFQEIRGCFGSLETGEYSGAKSIPNIIEASVPEEGEIDPRRATARAIGRGRAPDDFIGADGYEITTPGGVGITVRANTRGALETTVNFGRDSGHLASEMLAKLDQADLVQSDWSREWMSASKCALVHSERVAKATALAAAAPPEFTVRVEGDTLWVSSGITLQGDALEASQRGFEFLLAALTAAGGWCDRTGYQDADYRLRLPNES